MKIGVISDTHDREAAITAAIARLRSEEVQLILHCGDIESPETVHLFKDVPTHFVFGNWDRDQSRLQQAIDTVGGTANGTFGYLELAGKKIAWIHSHLRGHLRTLETDGGLDYLFYGHSHEKEMHRTGKTLVVNPGAIFRANPKTCRGGQSPDRSREMAGRLTSLSIGNQLAKIDPLHLEPSLRNDGTKCVIDTAGLGNLFPVIRGLEIDRFQHD